jgi:flagellar basal-body rod protein FlgG
MFDALYIGATGMQAQQVNVETIANNLANANTPAFKKGRVGFSELMVGSGNRIVQLSNELRAGALSPAQSVGSGVGISSMSKVFDAGELKKTDSPLDVAIRGEGFLEVTLPDGSSAYMRGGSLKVNKDGLLANQAANPLRPSISVPDNAQSIVIGPDGKISITLPNQGTPVDLGQLDLVRFANPGQLSATGDNLFRATDASGEAMSARAGEDGAGNLAQGFVESSNVKMVDEMVNLMLAQRAYEANVKVVQAADEMLGLINNLRK